MRLRAGGMEPLRLLGAYHRGMVASPLTAHHPSPSSQLAAHDGTITISPNWTVMGASTRIFHSLASSFALQSFLSLRVAGDSETRAREDASAPVVLETELIKANE